MVSVGQIVFAKAGRDKGDAFIVTKVIEPYVFIANGKSRTLLKPKKKKMIHIQITHFIDEEIKNKIITDSYLLDSDIRKSLKKYYTDITQKV